MRRLWHEGDRLVSNESGLGNRLNVTLDTLFPDGIETMASFPGNTKTSFPF
jgi:hypothetical protein